MEEEYVKALEATRKEDFEEIISQDLEEFLSKYIRFTKSDIQEFSYNIYYKDNLIFTDVYEWNIDHMFHYPLLWTLQRMEKDALEDDYEKVSRFRDLEKEKEIENTKKNYIRCPYCHKFYKKDSEDKHYCDI